MKAFYGLLFVFFLTIGVTPSCMALTGRWRGNLNMGVAKLSLVFNFNENADGTTVATMDCLQQNAKGIPFDVLVCTADSVAVECKILGAFYTARIEQDKIVGTFSQSGFRLPLTLEPESDLRLRRPQTPVPPFPYEEKDTVFYSADGTELAGTLTIPDATEGGKMPVVVMVTGSGPQNRDEEVFEHRPFAVIADYLARNGVASFRYDDRGVSSSKGSYPAATIDTFETDAKSALRFVRTLPGFDRHGVLGHSEGGTLAILLAPEEKPDFIISLAGVSVPVRNMLLAQNAHALDLFGVKGEQKDASIRFIELTFDAIREQYLAGESKPLDIDAICKENALDVPTVVLESVKQNMKTRNGYFDSLVSLDPTESLGMVTCPVLAINGTKDTQVDAEVNLAAFSKHVKNVDVRRMEGLNHLMQHAQTGEMTEYGDIKETISPEVLKIIVDFIKQK